jgi:formylglycine-generating enzyme required for sulfatase activity/tetratricopeptide (TPR) repeat protein
LARQTAEFARFGDPAGLVEAEWRRAVGMADEMRQSGYTSLAWLLSQRPREGMPVLVVAVRYFFRRAVEEDQKLFQGLSFARLEALGEAQEKGFASLSTALAQRGERLEELLADVKAVVVQTHSAVLDLQGQMKGHGEQIEQIGQAVMQLLEQHRLQQREVRPGDSLSIRSEGERQLVKQLVARYRSLPEGQRRNVPSLLNAIGKLEVVAGDFEAAQRDFQQVATMVDDTKAQAEAHFNAYQTALERQDFDAALKEFIEAVKLDGKRYAPFPVGKYHPLRILGAGGFGTAFLCRHRYMNADVVVKALHLDALGRDTDKVFTEAQALRELDHPAIIRISECGYADVASKGRAHIIMDYFQGQTLDGYVKEHGPLSVEDVLRVARQVAEGLQAAHGARILHRDVKPANVLVRKEATGWKVKIIDFGLAMPQKVAETSQKASTARQKETMVGSSIAGTQDYGAPEQMGRRQEPVGPYSDVYGWAKTCCYALFQTTQPLMKHWNSLPRSLAELLEKCLEEDPKQRPSGFAEVLKGLDTGADSSAAAPVVPEEGFDFERPEREAVDVPGARTTRKKPKKGLLPWVLGGVGVLAVALVVVFGFVLGGPKKEGPRLIEPGKKATPDQAGGKTVSADKDEQQPRDMPKEKDKPNKNKDTRDPVLTPSSEHRPGEIITNSLGMKFVLIPAGKFKMGSTEAERQAVLALIKAKIMPAWLKAEGPQHEVEITKAFYLGVHQVTQKQFKEVMGYNPSYFSTDGKGREGVKYPFVTSEPGRGRDKVMEVGNTDDFPVENVSWVEARTFLEKLSSLPGERSKGRQYRLPSEAEREYACRGGAPSHQTFHFGDRLSSTQANFDGNYPYGGAEKGPSLRRTCKVGSYKANAFGLHDMHGNVWEWCSDWFDEHYYERSPRKDPQGPDTGANRVFRGGTWHAYSAICRSAYRSSGYPGHQFCFVGFRAVLILPAE